MTKKIKENIERPKDNIENFKLLIEEYCNIFLDSRELMEKEKLQNGGAITLEKLLYIFSDFNEKKQEIIDGFFTLNDDEKFRIKNIELPSIFSKSEGVAKRAVGEIKAGIENNLIK